jgi:hypothetical protein
MAKSSRGVLSVLPAFAVFPIQGCLFGLGFSGCAFVNKGLKASPADL